MDRQDRREARIALAMLPVGGTLTIVSVAAAIVVALLALDTVVHQPKGTAWLLAWCLAAIAVATFNTRRAIEVMSAFDWRPLRAIAALSATITVAYPGWWL